MANKINITIPQSCHENWQEMTVVEKGKFCSSCQKNVFDFTKSTDREIYNAVEKNENLCGRFLSTQLNRDLIIPKEKKSFWLATTTAIISIIGLGNHEAIAQEPVKTEQTDKKVLSDSIKTNNTEFEVTGVVYDDKNIPIPGVNVVVKNSKKGVQTNFDGKFIVTTKKDDILIISFLGYSTKEIKVYNNKPINVILDEENLLLGEVVYVKNRTAFGKFFHSIGNSFR